MHTAAGAYMALSKSSEATQMRWAGLLPSGRRDRRRYAAQTLTCTGRRMQPCSRRKCSGDGCRCPGVRAAAGRVACGNTAVANVEALRGRRHPEPASKRARRREKGKRDGEGARRGALHGSQLRPKSRRGESFLRARSRRQPSAEGGLAAWGGLTQRRQWRRLRRRCRWPSLTLAWAAG